MSRTITAPMLALATLLAMPATASAYSGLGCTNLPAYDRAVGALQGLASACDMSVEEARRIVAAHDAANAGVPTAVGPHKVRRGPVSQD